MAPLVVRCPVNFVELRFADESMKLLRGVPTPTSLTTNFFFLARPRWSLACAWWGSSPTSPLEPHGIMAITAVIFCTAAARC